MKESKTITQEEVVKLFNRQKEMENLERTNECNTRGLLIEPMLRILGYCTDDLNECDREHSIKVTAGCSKSTCKIDYVLFPDASNKKKVILVESKPLTQKLEISDKEDSNKATPIEQITSYMRAAKEKEDTYTVLRGILTNGKDWRVYCYNGDTIRESFVGDLELLISSDKRRELFSKAASKDFVLKIGSDELEKLKIEQQDTDTISQNIKAMLTNPDKFFRDENKYASFRNVIESKLPQGCGSDIKNKHFEKMIEKKKEG